MMLSDDLWAYQRMRSHDDIAECTSFRVEVGGVVHRLVGLKKTQHWSSLCGLNRLWPAACDLSVNCFGCLAEGA